MSLVLIAIDESEHAEAAFRFYVEHLHKTGNQLLLVHAAEISSLSSTPGVYMSAATWQMMLHPYKEKANKLTEHYHKLMKEHHMAGKIKWFFQNNPGVAIVEQANENQASLIVMGTRGLGRLRRTILGSVSDYVLHHARCAVTICRHKADREDRATDSQEQETDENEGLVGDRPKAKAKKCNLL